MNKIQVAGTEDNKIRTNGEYESHRYRCSIINCGGSKKILGTYECYYTVRTTADGKSIEDPGLDVHAMADCAAPEGWDMCCVTELVPEGKGLILRATFNVYKQLHVLGNKRFYASACVDVVKI